MKAKKISNKAYVIAYLDQASPGWRKGIKLSERDEKAVKTAKAERKARKAAPSMTPVEAAKVLQEVQAIRSQL